MSTMQPILDAFEEVVRRVVKEELAKQGEPKAFGEQLKAWIKDNEADFADYVEKASVDENWFNDAVGNAMDFDTDSFRDAVYGVLDDVTFRTTVSRY